MHHGAAFALKAIETGAVGYVTEGSDPRNIIHAITGAPAGRTRISPDVIEAMAQHRNKSGRSQHSTDRDTKTARRSMPVEEIAGILCIGPKTVRNTHSGVRRPVPKWSGPP